MSLITAGSTALSAISPYTFARQVGSLIREARSGSVIEYSQNTRIDSLTLVDTRAAQLPYIDSILGSMLNIVTAYYLQAISVSSVSDARVMKTLGKFNPDREILTAAAGSSYLSMQSLESANAIPLFDGSMSLEDSFTQENTKVPAKSIDSVESGNLSVGKLVNIDITEGDHTVTFPINVRLMANLLNPKQMVDLLTHNVHGRSIKERWHLMKSGQIRFIKDFLLCQDIIDDHKRRLINDSTGIYKSRSSRQSKNRVAAMLSGQPSIAQASSLQILTAETAKEIEHAARIRFNDFRGREKYLDTNLAMIVAVVDPDWENVTLYYRSIPDVNVVSIKDIEKINKSKGGPDILEVLNSLREVKAPTM